MTDNDRSLTTLATTTTKTVFTTHDLLKFWQYHNYTSLIQRISYLHQHGKLSQIKKGLYALPGRPVDEFELANKLRSPSYLSFETVLYRHGIIFQWNTTITLAAKESITLRVSNHTILFKQVKDEILLNKTGIIQEHNYAIATPERAIADMLYINGQFPFDNLRSVDFEVLAKIAEIYDKKSVIAGVKKLHIYARSY